MEKSKLIILNIITLIETVYSMKNLESKISNGQNKSTNLEREGTSDIDESVEKEKLMENFYQKYFETKTEKARKISLENLKEMKERGITTEQFLDYLCQKHGFLLHGSIHEIADSELKSRWKKIFATNKSAIAIMRSIYSNINVNLEYPYCIDENDPLILAIHTPPDGKFISVERGYIYVIDASGFKNDPEGSWQFIKESGKVGFRIIIETEKSDFRYPIKISNDFDLDN